VKCDGAQELLIEYADGDLTPADEAAVRQHVSECDGCAAELADIEALRTLLADDGYVEPSSFYWTRFRAGLRRKLAGRTRFADLWQERRLVPRLATIAVAVVCFGAGLWAGLGPNIGRDADEGRGMYAERARVSNVGSPLISSRSKHIVESGIEHESFAFTADTLRPESFRQLPQEPRIYLATSERQAEMERRLGQ